MNTALLLALFALAPSALAKGGKLAVVEMASPPNLVGLAGQVTRTLLKSAADLGMTPVAPDELRAQLGEKSYQELRGCAANAGCAATRLSAVGAERAVIGSFDRDEKNYLLKLWLVDLRKQQVIAEVDRSILIASRRLTQDIQEAVPAFLQGKREALGTLVVTSNVRGAEVRVDGEPRGPTPVTVKLKPGKHEVKLEKKNHLPVTRLVDVEANQKTEEQVRLILEPGAAPEPEPVQNEAVWQPTRDGEGRPGLQLPTLTWVAGGVAVAAAGLGTFLGVSAAGKDADLKAGYDPVSDLYAGTRRSALEARQQALFANVAFGVAGAAAVTAVVAAVVHRPTESRLEVSPVAGTGGAGVMLGGGF